MHRSIFLRKGWFTSFKRKKNENYIRRFKTSKRKSTVLEKKEYTRRAVLMIKFINIMLEIFKNYETKDLLLRIVQYSATSLKIRE